MDKKRGFILFLFLLLIFFKGSILSTIVTSYNPIQLEFNLTKTELGIIATLFYIFSLIGSIFWTLYSGSLKRIPFLMLGCTILTIGMILIMISIQYWMILLAVSITGFGAEAFTIFLFNSYTDLQTGNKRSESISLFYVIQGAGTIFGTFFTGIFEGIWEIKWNYVFIMDLAGILLSTISLIILLKKIEMSATNSPQITQDEQSINMMFQPLNGEISKQMIHQTYSNKVNLYMFIFFLLFFPAQQITNIWLQKYWGEIHQLSQVISSISFIFTSGAEFLGIIFGGWLIDRYHNKSKFAISFVGIVASIFAAPLLSLGFSIPWNNFVIPESANYLEICWNMFIVAIQDPMISGTYITLFVGFFIIQFITPLIPTIILDVNPHNNKAFVINNIIILMNIGLVIGPILGGILGDLYGLEFALTIPTILYMIGGLIFILIHREYKKQIKPSQNNSKTE